MQDKSKHGFLLHQGTMLSRCMYKLRRFCYYVYFANKGVKSRERSNWTKDPQRSKTLSTCFLILKILSALLTSYEDYKIPCKVA